MFIAVLVYVYLFSKCPAVFESTRLHYIYMFARNDYQSAVHRADVINDGETKLLCILGLLGVLRLLIAISPSRVEQGVNATH